MRDAFFAGNGPGDEAQRYVIPVYAGETVLWAEPSLAGCLAILVACEWLVTANRDLSQASLALSPCISYKEPLETRDVRRALTERIPLEEVGEALVVVRREIASSDTSLSPDLAAVDARVRTWAELVLLLRGFLPDERGLDLVDAMILDELRLGRCRFLDLCNAQTQLPKGYDFGDIRLWERLLELSGLYPVSAMRSSREEEPLITLDIQPHHPLSVVQLTSFGSRVAEGRTSALKKRDFCRWVGGRYIQRDNLLVR
jgi:hypothetical protein